MVDESGNIVSTDVIYSRKPKVGDVRCMSMIRLDDYIDDSPGSQSAGSFESEEVEVKTDGIWTFRALTRFSYHIYFRRTKSI